MMTMKIQIVSHYSMYDPSFEGEVGFVTVEVPNRTGLFGAKENPVIQKFEQYGRASEHLQKQNHGLTAMPSQWSRWASQLQ